MRVVLHGVHEVDVALSQLARRVRDAEAEALREAGDRLGDAFRRRARRLSGDHADSFRLEQPRTSGDRVSIRGGPTMPYSRKISLRYGDFADALSDSSDALEDEMVRAYTRVVT